MKNIPLFEMIILTIPVFTGFFLVKKQVLPFTGWIMMLGGLVLLGTGIFEIFSLAKAGGNPSGASGVATLVVGIGVIFFVTLCGIIEVFLKKIRKGSNVNVVENTSDAKDINPQVNLLVARTGNGHIITLLYYVAGVILGIALIIFGSYFTLGLGYLPFAQFDRTGMLGMAEKIITAFIVAGIPFSLMVLPGVFIVVSIYRAIKDNEWYRSIWDELKVFIYTILRRKPIEGISSYRKIAFELLVIGIGGVVLLGITAFLNDMSYIHHYQQPINPYGEYVVSLWYDYVIPWVLGILWGIFCIGMVMMIKLVHINKR